MPSVSLRSRPSRLSSPVCARKKKKERKKIISSLFLDITVLAKITTGSIDRVVSSVHRRLPPSPARAPPGVHTVSYAYVPRPVCTYMYARNLHRLHICDRAHKCTHIGHI